MTPGWRHLGCTALIMLLIGGRVVAADAPERPEQRFERLYGELLAEYWHPPVRINGIRTTVFDYARMHRDAAAPNALFSRVAGALERVNPDALAGEDLVKAFWMNAYNFAAMKLAVDHYPVDSIRSFRISLLRYPWSRKAIRIGGRDYSLGEIEHDVLVGRTGDRRTVFAVSCAAVSCPDRSAEAFTADKLERQLETLIRTFFENPDKGARLDRERRTLTLAWILKKDQALFPSKDGGVLGFAMYYLPETDRQWITDHSVTVKYFDHDWSLNDLRLADRSVAGE
jgi:hypothetical protein